MRTNNGGNSSATARCERVRVWLGAQSGLPRPYAGMPAAVPGRKKQHSRAADESPAAAPAARRGRSCRRRHAHEGGPFRPSFALREAEVSSPPFLVFIAPPCLLVLLPGAPKLATKRRTRRDHDGGGARAKAGEARRGNGRGRQTKTRRRREGRGLVFACFFCCCQCAAVAAAAAVSVLSAVVLDAKGLELPEK